jgi:hypothetical protein
MVPGFLFTTFALAELWRLWIGVLLFVMIATLHGRDVRSAQFHTSPRRSCRWSGKRIGGLRGVVLRGGLGTTIGGVIINEPGESSSDDAYSSVYNAFSMLWLEWACVYSRLPTYTPYHSEVRVRGHLPDSNLTVRVRGFFFV